MSGVAENCMLEEPNVYLDRMSSGALSCGFIMALNLYSLVSP